MKTIKLDSVKFINTEIEKTIKLMLDNGFRIFVYKTDRISDCTYSCDNKVAYLQYSRFSGLEISTKHIPTKGIGTGFGEILDKKFDLDINDLKLGFIHAPKWANSSDVQIVRKYTLDQWIEKASKDILKYVELTK